MVIVGTKLVSSDNSGARILQCIKVLGSSNQHKIARIGDKIVVSVKSAAPKRKVKVHNVHLSILIRKKKTFFRYTGINIWFKKNSAVLIDRKRFVPLGTRVNGPIMYELRRKKYLKLLSIATSIV